MKKQYQTRKTGKKCYDILNGAGAKIGAAFAEPGSAGYLGIVETMDKTYMTGGMTIAEAAAAVHKLHTIVHRAVAPLPLGVRMEGIPNGGQPPKAYRVYWHLIQIALVCRNLSGQLWTAEPTQPLPPEELYQQRAQGRSADHAARVFVEEYQQRYGVPAEPERSEVPANYLYQQARMF